jgi:hypothetical protein
MQASEYVNAIMAGLGVALQFGRSQGMPLRSAVYAVFLVGVLVTLAVSGPLRALASQPGDFALWQNFVLEGLLQFVGILASGLGGLFAASSAAYNAVAAGKADPASPLVPITKP